MTLRITPRIGTRVGPFYVGANIYRTPQRRTTQQRTTQRPQRTTTSPRQARQQARNIQRQNVPAWVASQQQARRPVQPVAQRPVYTRQAPGSGIAAAGRGIVQAYVVLFAFVFLCAVVVMVVGAVGRIMQPTTVVVIPGSVPSITATHVPTGGGSISIIPNR